MMPKINISTSGTADKKDKNTASHAAPWYSRGLTKKGTSELLIDAFINAIFLYDGKMLITFNYKEGTKTITFDDVKRKSPTGLPQTVEKVQQCWAFSILYG